MNSYDFSEIEVIEGHSITEEAFENFGNESLQENVSFNSPLNGPLEDIFQEKGTESMSIDQNSRNECFDACNEKDQNDETKTGKNGKEIKHSMTEETCEAFGEESRPENVSLSSSLKTIVEEKGMPIKKFGNKSAQENVYFNSPLNGPLETIFHEKGPESISIDQNSRNECFDACNEKDQKDQNDETKTGKKEKEFKRSMTEEISETFGEESSQENVSFGSSLKTIVEDKRIDSKSIDQIEKNPENEFFEACNEKDNFECNSSRTTKLDGPHSESLC